MRVPAVAGHDQWASCCRVPLPDAAQWRAGRAAAITVRTVSRSSRTAVVPDPPTHRRPDGWSVPPAHHRRSGTTATGSAPKIGFLRVLLRRICARALPHTTTRYHIKIIRRGAPRLSRPLPAYAVQFFFFPYNIIKLLIL